MRYIKTLLAAALCCAIVACGSQNNSNKTTDKSAVESASESTEKVDRLYSIGLENRIYDDPAAEFDTLSYVLGMHHALSVQSLYLDADMDRELMIKGFIDILDAESLDLDALYDDVIRVNEFNEWCYRPYISQKQRNATLRHIDPNAEVEEPKLYTGTFKHEDICLSLGRRMAAELRMMQVPVNRRWVMQAFDDAAALSDGVSLDSVMQISMSDMKRVQSSQELSQRINPFLIERSKLWIDNVSKQEGVVALSRDDEETVYYRVDDSGNDKRPTSPKDSIYMEYSLYSCYGLPIESTKSMIEVYDRYAAHINAETSIDEAKLQEVNEEIKLQRDITASGGLTLQSFYFDVVGECIQKIGEGGSITVWLPASHISNVALGSRNLVYSNMGGVMTIHLKRVVPVSEQQIIKMVPTQIKTMNDKRLRPVTKPTKK